MKINKRCYNGCADHLLIFVVGVLQLREQAITGGIQESTWLLILLFNEATLCL